MLAKILKEERKKQGLTQQALADKLGIHRSDINNWETSASQISVAKLILLADYFNCSTDYLLGRTQERK